MPWHWCSDETMMLLTMIPFIGYYFKRVHTWLHVKLKHKCHEKGCNETHVEHEK